MGGMVWGRVGWGSTSRQGARRRVFKLAGGASGRASGQKTMQQVGERAGERSGQASVCACVRAGKKEARRYVFGCVGRMGGRVCR